MARPHFLVGDPVPWFGCPTSTKPRFNFQTMGGRYLVLSFLGSTKRTDSAEAAQHFIRELRPMFDDDKLAYFGLTIDPDDAPRLEQTLPGIRYFHDFAQEISVMYGALEKALPLAEALNEYKPYTLVLDPMMRVIANISIADAAQHNALLSKILNSLPSTSEHAQVPLCAPILIVPRVFEPPLCRQLIGLYEKHGGIESGSMTERDGMTVGRIDHNFKRRKDYLIDDPAVQMAMRQRIVRRLLPEIYKAFQYKASRIERYIVACYDGDSGGFFKPHRDNTTKGTAHRKFAVTINLNAEDYDGGDLRFPEFGDRTYRAPTGGAVVFSCSLLHEATPVTRGLRYATLPFLYDDESAKIRTANAEYLSGEIINENKS